MGLSELQKGFGPGLLRRSSPEGKLIAELQQACNDGLQMATVNLTIAQFKALSTLLTVVPAPPAGFYYEVVEMNLLYMPGSDVLTSPLTSVGGRAVGLHYGDPAVNTANADMLDVADILFRTVDFPILVLCFVGTSTVLNISEALGQPLTLQFSGGAETIGGNAAGDAKFRFSIYYRVRNLDF